MKYKREDFLCEIDESLICPICENVLESAKQLLDCKHIFCINCIENDIIINNRCPLEKIPKPLDKSGIVDAPEHITKYIGFLKIKCDFSSNGCTRVLDLNQLQLHRLNCEFHPKRRVKCQKCDNELGNSELDSHDCIKSMKNMIELQNKKIEALKEKYSKDVSHLKCQIQRMQNNVEILGQHLSSVGYDTGFEMSPRRQMISFSCITDSQIGTHEMVIIQTVNNMFKCEANSLTKIGQIKYIACSLSHINTIDYSLFANSVKLEDQHYLSQYEIHNQTLFQLLPNVINISFDCVDIKMIIEMPVSTSDTVKTIRKQLLSKIETLIPNQLYLYLRDCVCSLYYNDIKLEETYQLSNYDCLIMKTLRYCNRIAI